MFALLRQFAARTQLTYSRICSFHVRFEFFDSLVGLIKSFDRNLLISLGLVLEFSKVRKLLSSVLYLVIEGFALIEDLLMALS